MTTNHTDLIRNLREAIDGLMTHQWSNNKPAMHALQLLVDYATDAADALEAMQAAPALTDEQIDKICATEPDAIFTLSIGDPTVEQFKAALRKIARAIERAIRSKA